MTDPSPYLTIATSLQAVIADEFQAEGFTAILDNLHESLGRRRTDIGIAPAEDRPTDARMIQQETYVEVRFYDLWTQEISPDTVVDPTRITGYAERFRRAVQRAQAVDPGTDDVWFFDVTRVQYPNDPTGNKTRFVATIRAYGNNTGIVETVG